MKPPSAADQLRIISSGIERIIPEDDFRDRLERSVATGVPLRVKLGLDPSAPDIHIGHAVVLRTLRRFQEFGHTAVLIIGDFTGMVGDPTDRSRTRPMLTEEEIARNAETYADQIRRVLLPEPLEVVRNSTWLAQLGTAGMLRLAGKMTVARLLERDDFARRYASGQPISLVEFCYPLLQGYDSVAVRADVEMGATEQTFNLLVGRDLQQDAGQPPQCVITHPILVGLDGEKKMSKSLGNYVGVTDPPEEMYGKLMSIPDRLLADYLRLATDIDPAEAEQIVAGAATGGKAAADAKRRLAYEVTAIYHGADAARAAGDRFNVVHVDRALPADLRSVPIPDDTIDAASGRVAIARLVVAVGAASTTSEARRVIEGRGVRLDERVIDDPKAALDPRELAGAVLKVGKRFFVRLEAP